MALPAYPLWRFKVPGRGVGIDVRAKDVAHAWQILRSSDVPKKLLRDVADPVKIGEANPDNVVPLLKIIGARQP